MTEVCLLLYRARTLKFKRVSLNETSEFPLWGIKICVDFFLRDFKKNGEYENSKLKNIS